MRPEWLALHAFHRGNLDTMLLACIHPLVRDLRKDAAIESYFFVRYWNGGAHIRLRLLPAAGTDPESVHAVARRSLKEFLAKHPGGEAEADQYGQESAVIRGFHDRLQGQRKAGGMQDREEVEPLQPAGTVQRRRYAFEYERYGGESGRVVSEQHFEHSADLALSVIAAMPESLGKRLMLALCLMAATTRSLGLSYSESAGLFGQQFALVAYLLPGVGLEGFLKRFGFRSYSDQAEIVQNVLRQGGAAKGRESGHSATQAFVSRWEGLVGSVAQQLERLRTEGRLSGSVAEIVMSYQHMLMNRLGIPTIQELYLSYLLAEGFRAADRQVMQLPDATAR